MEFEIGQTTSSDHFFKSHPTFIAALNRLMDIGDAAFARTFFPKNRLEDIGFDLGQTCREDYLEIVFLTVHGQFRAATKLLRGLYERALSLAYMVTDPRKAERFVRFAAIQEHHMMEAALQLVSESAFDEVMAPKGESAAQIRNFYQAIKPEFQITLCKRCGTKRTQTSWDIDVASMAKKVGQPYSGLYLLAYTIPTSMIHATLASASDEAGGSRNHGDTTFVATEIYLQVLRSQNALFSLGLDTKLDRCTDEFRVIWHEIDPEYPVSDQT